MARILLPMVLGLAALGCGDREGRHERERTVARGVQVANVNGESIGHDEVAALCRATGMSPKQALDRLIALHLLAQHARTLGYDHSAEVARGVRQASVQALLAEAVERGSGPTDLDARKRKLERLLSELGRGSKITYEEDAIAKLFAGAPP